MFFKRTAKTSWAADISWIVCAVGAGTGYCKYRRFYALDRNVKKLVSKHDKSRIRYKAVDLGPLGECGGICSHNYGIAVLKMPKDAKNNESRDNENTRYSKFRANKMKVLAIYDGKGNEYDIAYSIYSNQFIYVKSVVVEATSYNKDIRQICDPGIHYYKTLVGAKGHVKWQHKGKYLNGINIIDRGWCVKIIKNGMFCHMLNREPKKMRLHELSPLKRWYMEKFVFL